MKVYVKPPSHLSQAMFRVERALMKHAPDGIRFVDRKSDADLVFLHVIGHPETVEEIVLLKDRGQEYVVIQYALRTTQKPNTYDWLEPWKSAALVWSYYDLKQAIEDDGLVSLKDINFYHTPLGVDDEFRKPFFETQRTGILTSGYVSAFCAEAIEEAAFAALALNQPVNHLGPVPVGMVNPVPSNWITNHGISDVQLASIYRSSKWVSGLRHVEGFELPAAEGLCCGARPIVFDRPEMRKWYGEHAVFIPECSGQPLIELLIDTMRTDPVTVSRAERQQVLDTFNWETIIQGLWERL